MSIRPIRPRRPSQELALPTGLPGILHAACHTQVRWLRRWRRQREGNEKATRAMGDGMRFTGGIFDVDGVLLETPHEQAWRDALDQLMLGPWRTLAPSTSYRPGALTAAVYQ